MAQQVANQPKLTKALREALEMAKRQGFDCTLLSTTRSNHFKVQVKAPDGMVFTSTVGSSPSDRRANKNWISQLKNYSRSHPNLPPSNNQQSEVPLMQHPWSDKHQPEYDAVLQYLAQDHRHTIVQYDNTNDGLNNNFIWSKAQGLTTLTSDRVKAVVARKLLADEAIVFIGGTDRAKRYALAPTRVQGTPPPAPNVQVRSGLEESTPPIPEPEVQHQMTSLKPTVETVLELTPLQQALSEFTHEEQEQILFLGLQAYVGEQLAEVEKQAQLLARAQQQHKQAEALANRAWDKLHAPQAV